MKKENTIEKIYQDSFKDFNKQPSKKVWENIDNSINKPNFLTFTAGKFNVFYLAGLISAVVLITIYFQQNNKESNMLAISETTNNIMKSRTANNISQFDNNTNNNISCENNKVQQTETDNEIKGNWIKVNNIISASNESKMVEINSNFSGFFTPTTQKTVVNYNISLMEGCAPLKIEFNNRSENYKSADWDLGNGMVLNQPSITHTYTKPGIYVVSLKVVGENITKTLYDTIKVYETPSSNFETTKTVYKDNKIKFINQSVNAIDYKWYFGDGLVSNKENPFHTYKETGDYKVKLITCTENKCCDTAFFALQVLRQKSAPFVNQTENKMNFPNAFAPSKLGGNGGYYSSKKVDNTIFHPTTESIIHEYQLRVYDKRGLLLFETNEFYKGWDGYYKDVIIPVGVYVYEVKGSYEDGEKFYFNGDITVIY